MSTELAFSILMPTYNRADLIEQSVRSVKAQTHPHWELIIVDDGSTDDTRAVVERQEDPRIRYIYQPNAGQLNALLTASRRVVGDVVMLLHSDDRLIDEGALERIASRFMADPGLDGVCADYVTIDESGRDTGFLKTWAPDRDGVLKRILFTRGVNGLGDHFAVTRHTFDRSVLPNYIMDSTVYYLGIEKLAMLRLAKIEPWYQYRVFPENYTNSPIGRYVIHCGRLRTICKIFRNSLFLRPHLALDSMPFKLARKFGLIDWLKLRAARQNRWALVRRYYEEWKRYMLDNRFPELAIRQVDRIAHSAACRQTGVQAKALPIEYRGEDHYHGKDARKFYRDYEGGKVNAFYERLLCEDYDHIVYRDAETGRHVETVLRYFSLFYRHGCAG